MCVLPNLWLQAAIGCDLAVLAPPNDHRIMKFKAKHPAFESFLSRFTDNFGEKFEPAVLILREDAPPSYREVKAISSFRNLIALSAITYSRARKLTGPFMGGVFYGEAFSIYPWMLDRNDENLIGSTPAILGSRDLDKFQGQSSPAVFRTLLDKGDLDEPLLTELMKRWRRRYDRSEPELKDVALMRSLNMAYNAALLPAGTDKTFLDEGRIVALWVSAFEILAHPGPDGHVSRDKVFGLLEDTKWSTCAFANRKYCTGSKNETKERSLASWLYQRLYDCRNDFLHGNPVERSNLMLPASRKNISEYAASLYRIALTAVLPLAYNRSIPSIEDLEAPGADNAGKRSFTEPQELAEKALMTAATQNDDAENHMD